MPETRKRGQTCSNAAFFVHNKINSFSQQKNNPFGLQNQNIGGNKRHLLSNINFTPAN